MKKLFIPLLIGVLLPSFYSCSGTKGLGYSLTQADAAAAVRQMLELGARQGVNGAFSKDAIMATIFPEQLRKTLNTLQQLGLSNEVDRFVNTLTTASEKTAERSIPIFVTAINNLSFADAIYIIKSGGTAATDYLRSTTGTQLRNSIKPVMQAALDEYKLTEQWNKLMKPAQQLVGNKINFDLPNLMAGLVSEKMFQKIEQKEIEVRANAYARTTPLLKKVFSRNW